MFCVVEQKEPHPGRFAFAEIEQPTSFAGRCALARRLRDELEVTLPIFVDGMDDASRALFSDLPSPAFVIDRAGLIADKLPWADPDQLRASIGAVLADDGLPALDAALSVDQRAVFARRFVAAGKPETALAWLDTQPKGDVCVPPTFVAVAQAALARCAALRGADGARREAALVAAGAAAAEAWAKEPGRLAAARIELAELAAGTAVELASWRAALDALEPRAPEATREWLRRQVAARQPAAAKPAGDAGKER